MSTVKVTAPADLMEGYTFDASANGKTFRVTVPAGGVKAGDEIEVPVPTEDTPAASQGATGGYPMKGKFSHNLFDCFQTCPCPFFMGWCCPGIMAGQVFQRLKLNALGQPGDYKNTCTIMTAIFILAWILAIAIGIPSKYGYFVWYFFYFYVFVVVMIVRIDFRKKYNIPGEACGDGALDDCCCAFWCTCCTIIQIHRHTHDENLYKYDITSKTGLPANAPEIV